MKRRRLRIREPIWATRSIGIAEDKVPDFVDIEIMYKTKPPSKERLYPHIYTITREDLLRYPTQILKSHILHIVPIHHLHIKEFR